MGCLPVERGPAVVRARDGSSIRPSNPARNAPVVALFLPPDLWHLYRWDHPLRVCCSPPGVCRLRAHRFSVAGRPRVVLALHVGWAFASLLSPFLDAL